jgi:hypothetical protein
VAGELEEAFERVQEALGLSDIGMMLVKNAADPVATLRNEMKIARPTALAKPMRPRVDVCREVMSKLVAGLVADAKLPVTPTADQAPLKLV